MTTKTKDQDDKKTKDNPASNEARGADDAFPAEYAGRFDGVKQALETLRQKIGALPSRYDDVPTAELAQAVDDAAHSLKRALAE